MSGSLLSLMNSGMSSSSFTTITVNNGYVYSDIGQPGGSIVTTGTFATTTNTTSFSGLGAHFFNGSLHSTATTNNAGIYIISGVDYNAQAIPDTVIWRSTNAINWTKAFSINGVNNYLEVFYLNNIFIALQHASSTIYHTSTDGITWTVRNLPNNATAYSVNKSFIVNNKLFMSDSNNSNYYYSTIDGINWTVANTNIATSIGPSATIYYSGLSSDLLLICDSNSNKYYKTSDLQNFIEITSPYSIQQSNVNDTFLSGTNNVWFAVTRNSSKPGLDLYLKYSTDLITWYNTSLIINWKSKGIFFSGFKVVYKNNLWFIISPDSFYFYVSSDLINWRRMTGPGSLQFFDFINNVYTIVGRRIDYQIGSSGSTPVSITYAPQNSYDYIVYYEPGIHKQAFVINNGTVTANILSVGGGGGGGNGWDDVADVEFAGGGGGAGSAVLYSNQVIASESSIDVKVGSGSKEIVGGETSYFGLSRNAGGGAVGAGKTIAAGSGVTFLSSGGGGSSVLPTAGTANNVTGFAGGAGRSSGAAASKSGGGGGGMTGAGGAGASAVGGTAGSGIDYSLYLIPVGLGIPGQTTTGVFICGGGSGGAASNGVTGDGSNGSLGNLYDAGVYNSGYGGDGASYGLFGPV